MHEEYAFTVPFDSRRQMGSGHMLQFTGSSFTVAETGKAAPGLPEPVSPGAGAGEAGTTASGGREDLTVFFAIGVVVDVFLVAAFLVWAARQWRKTK